MYLEGSEFVEYTPVEAYGVSTYANGIISGGNEGDNTISGGIRFLWIYDPDNLSGSGFTGKGWFCGEKNTPLEHVTEAELIEEFESGRTDLNSYFQDWKIYLDSLTEDNNYVMEFAFKIYSSACVIYEGE